MRVEIAKTASPKLRKQQRRLRVDETTRCSTTLYQRYVFTDRRPVFFTSCYSFCDKVTKNTRSMTTTSFLDHRFQQGLSKGCLLSLCFFTLTAAVFFNLSLRPFPQFLNPGYSSHQNQSDCGLPMGPSVEHAEDSCQDAITQHQKQVRAHFEDMKNGTSSIFSKDSWAAKTAGVLSSKDDTEIELDCHLFENDHRILYFLHIHKSGGSTMCSAARANHYFGNYADNCNTPRRCCGTTQQSHEAFAESTNFRFVANEWPMIEIMDTTHFRYIITLRDSLSRYVSDHGHYRQFHDDSFEDWIQGQPDNLIVRMVCGDRCLQRPKFRLTVADLLYTIDRLHRFDDILLLEDFDYTFHRFASRVGWSFQPGKKNPGKPGLKQPELPQVDSRYTALDNVVYASARSRFPNRGTAPESRLYDQAELYFANNITTDNDDCGKPCCPFPCNYVHGWGKYMNSLLDHGASVDVVDD